MHLIEGRAVVALSRAVKGSGWQRLKASPQLWIKRVFCCISSGSQSSHGSSKGQSNELG